METIIIQINFLIVFNNNSIKFSYGVNGCDYDIMECIDTHINCLNTIFINTSHHQRLMFYSNTNNIMKLSKCTFIDSHSVLYNSVCIFENCYSDRSFAGQSFISISPDTIASITQNDYLCINSCQLSSINNRNVNKYHHIPLIISFILLKS